MSDNKQSLRRCLSPATAACFFGLRLGGRSSCAYSTNNATGLSGGHKHAPPPTPLAETPLSFNLPPHSFSPEGLGPPLLSPARLVPRSSTTCRYYT